MPNTNNVDHININDLGKVTPSDIKSLASFVNANNTGETPQDNNLIDISGSLIQIGSNRAISLLNLSKVFDNFIARHNDLPSSTTILPGQTGNLNSTFANLFGNLSNGMANSPSFSTPKNFQDIFYYILQLIYGVGNTIYTNIYPYIGYTGGTSGDSLTELINTLFTRTGVSDSQYTIFPPSGARVSLMDRINYLYAQTFSKGSNNLRTSWESNSQSLAIRIDQIEDTLGINNQDTTTVIERVTNLERQLVNIINNSLAPRKKALIQLMDVGGLVGSVSLTIKGGTDYIQPVYTSTNGGSSWDEQNVAGGVHEIVIDLDNFVYSQDILDVSNFQSASGTRKLFTPRYIQDGNKATIFAKSLRESAVNITGATTIDASDISSSSSETLSTSDTGTVPPIIGDFTPVSPLPPLEEGKIEWGGSIEVLPELPFDPEPVEPGTPNIVPWEPSLPPIEPIRSTNRYIHIAELGTTLTIKNAPTEGFFKIVINDNVAFCGSQFTGSYRATQVFKNYDLNWNNFNTGDQIWYLMEVTYEPPQQYTFTDDPSNRFSSFGILRIQITPYPELTESSSE